MKIYKNLKINYITVLDDKITKIENTRYNLCSCKCGNIKYINRTTLLTRAIQDCGCGTFVTDQYIGRIYGKLKVVGVSKELTKNSFKNICHCKCECGKETKVYIGALNAGKVKSCGCSHSFDFNKYIGRAYNGNVILEFIDNKNKKVLCRCSCGNLFTCKIWDLTSCKSGIKNCGKCETRLTDIIKCYRFNKPTRIQNTYHNMLSRCYNQKNPQYKYYGGRGIKVCDEWKNSFKNFEEWAYKNNYDDNLTIDRINNDGDYEPNNCRWTTRQEQNENTRQNRNFSYNGGIYCLSKIAKMCGINRVTLSSRLKSGMSIEEATTKPVKNRK